MSLPNAILFPQALLPLFIFEPRYRQMLRTSLEDQRMFAVALGDGTHEPNAIGGLGLIRACVDKPDGTSNLILQGVSRVRFKGFTQSRPYWIGHIEALDTEDGDNVEVDALATKLREVLLDLHKLGHMPGEGIIKYLTEVSDYDALADIVTYTFIEDMQLKQDILETLNLRERFHKVLVGLRKQLSDKIM
ncbi:MAG: LON peptidase substrate-binding domain-containing protein [Candidatus Methylacidiphilales bacterium]|nr:LON peptidase substrate-binding domain-containing protein [Candidatus Methylacidiphilales bacterium]